MSDSTTMTATPETVIRKHPIRGVLWGLMFGIGLTLVLVFTKLISLDLTTMIIVTVLGMVAGVVWGLFGPAKAPKGPAPAHHGHRTPPPVSRFDDFTDVRSTPASDAVTGTTAAAETAATAATAETTAVPAAADAAKIADAADAAKIADAAEIGETTAVADAAEIGDSGADADESAVADDD